MEQYGVMLPNDNQSFPPFGATCGEMRQRLQELITTFGIKQPVPVTWNEGPANAQIQIIPLASTIRGDTCLRFNGLCLTLYRIGNAEAKSGEIPKVDSHGLLSILTAMPYSTPFFVVPTGVFPPAYYGMRTSEIVFRDGEIRIVP